MDKGSSPCPPLQGSALLTSQALQGRQGGKGEGRREGQESQGPSRKRRQEV